MLVIVRTFTSLVPVLVRSFPYTPHASYCENFYIPGASFSGSFSLLYLNQLGEEFLLHTSFSGSAFSQE